MSSESKTGDAPESRTDGALEATSSVESSAELSASPQPVLENGFAVLPAGDWVCGVFQPAACKGTVRSVGLKGWIVPDRQRLRHLSAGGACWFSEQRRPFLARLDAMPDEALCVVSSKVLVAPFGSRRKGRLMRLVPMNFKSGVVYTEFQGDWVVVATSSRVTRVALEDGETLTVRPEAVVAWHGLQPTGYCPRLSVWDILLPRMPRQLSFSFHGPSVVWLEGVGGPVEKGRNGLFSRRGSQCF